MSPLDGKLRWVFVVETAILFCGILVQNGISQSYCKNQSRYKNVIIVSEKRHAWLFPSETLSTSSTGIQICVVHRENKTDSGCCETQDFNCNFEIKRNDNRSCQIDGEGILSEQRVVVITDAADEVRCTPSKIYNKSSDLLSCLNKCLNNGEKTPGCNRFRSCRQYNDADYSGNTSVTTTPSGKTAPSVSNNVITEQLVLTIPNVSDNVSAENAANIMRGLSSLVEQMGDSREAYVSKGDIKGVIMKLPKKNRADINFGIKRSGEISTQLETGFSKLVKIPKEASDQAVKKNGSYAGVVLFPAFFKGDSFFLDNEALGIEMGAEISNLSDTIDIHYTNVNKNGSVASCRSWNGEGKEAVWITDGCQTNQTADNITCHCSHLTFFAVLMSPPTGNISSSDFTSLTYITSIGCGLSMFFLGVGIFMHFLIRRWKANQSTSILMNLFIAMFTLNLCFLVNESIADLGNFSACVVAAAVMHYSMLATFSWFFIQALHLYFNLWRLAPKIEHYMVKMCVAGWVTPAVVVIALIASQKYDFLIISIDDGNSEKMCWIADAAVHQGVNIGYYGVVFVFTFTVFFTTVYQIVMFKSAEAKAQDASSIKTNSFTILGLFILLGITWAFSFFSYGPLRIPAYYIFTILNSFQGLFLFIYYYNLSRVAGDGRGLTSSSSTSSSTAVISPYT